jgi:hypothetical protein
MKQTCEGARGLSVNLTRSSMLLIAAVLISLGGCAHKPAPCPVTTPPPRLMVPPESPATRERLMQLLPPTLPPANATPNGSGDSNGG